MPLYEFACEIDTHPRHEHFLSTDHRDDFKPRCGFCKKPMKRLPGGHGMLYFEEGRGRMRNALSDKPITSHAEHQRLMRRAGVVEAGNTLPRGIASREPKTEAMKRFRSKDQRGKWL